MAAVTSTLGKDLSQLLLLGCGNPLLDISAEGIFPFALLLRCLRWPIVVCRVRAVPEEMLTKYEVKLNNAILAEPKHLPMFVFRLFVCQLQRSNGNGMQVCGVG